MGCDIHGRVQRRYDNREKWFDDGEIEDARNYPLFAALAGVRGYGLGIAPISEPRGLPADNAEAPDDFWFGDHSYSWLTLAEIRDWPGWDTKPDGCLWTMRERCNSFLRWLAWQETRFPAEARIVFGFDN